ncbi:MAG: hypothetical protein ACYC9Z_00755 [Casimicrobiaceae bacterium]
MNAPIVFYFDFSSPYGYIGSQKIEALAARRGRSVDGEPFRGVDRLEQIDRWLERGGF